MGEVAREFFRVPGQELLLPGNGLLEEGQRRGRLLREGSKAVAAQGQASEMHGTRVDVNELLEQGVSLLEGLQRFRALTKIQLHGADEVVATAHFALVRARAHLALVRAVVRVGVDQAFPEAEGAPIVEQCAVFGARLGVEVAQAVVEFGNFDFQFGILGQLEKETVVVEIDSCEQQCFLELL